MAAHLQAPDKGLQADAQVHMSVRAIYLAVGSYMLTIAESSLPQLLQTSVSHAWGLAGI